MRIFKTLVSLDSDDCQGLLPGLPDEVAILCLAKVPLNYRHVMRAVCTSWRDAFNDNIFWDGRASETFLLFGAPKTSRRPVWHCLHQSSKEWTKLPPIPGEEKMHGSSTSAVIGGKLFVVGGWFQDLKDRSETVASSAVFYFDMKSYKWIRTASLNVARANCLAGVIKNRLYVCGGRIGHRRARTIEETLDYNKVWTNTAEVYDPASETWTLVASMGSRVRAERATVIDEELYVPYYKNNMALQGMKYDPRNDKWSDISESLSITLKNVPVVFNGRVFTRDAFTHYSKSEIRTYDIDKDTDELFCRVFHNLLFEDNVVALEDKLLVFEGKLCIVYRYLLDDRLQYVIKDLNNRVVASSELLILGAREVVKHAERYRHDKVDIGPESVEYQIMLL